MKKRNKLSLLTGMLLAVVMYGCSDSVGTINYTTPPVEPGERVLTIRVESAAGAALTGYDLNITGPTSASVSNVGSSTYAFSNLNNGEYTITATRTGYVEGAVREQIELPADIGADFRGEVKVVLTPRAPAQPVSNASGATVQTAPAPGTTTATTTLTIPPNAFPASVLDANGNVNIGVTRAKAGATTQTSQANSTPADVFDFEPSGVTLNAPVEAELEVNLPANLSASGLEMVLEGADGTILTLTPANTSVSKTFVNEDGELMAVVRVRALISRFQQYSLVLAVRVTRTNGWTNYRTVASSPSCGAGVNAVYNFSRGAINATQQDYLSLLTNMSLSDITTNNQYSATKNVEGIPGTRSIVRARNRTQTIAFVRGNTTLSSVTFNLNIVEFTVDNTACHNSGGN